ncbi:MAG: hypothetical protein HQ567_24775 [Candidatus Nealsonbacteria bacterium]|nr:hypothetical protein [Candidatus Nealsonbacteria bacterium]
MIVKRHSGVKSPGNGAGVVNPGDRAGDACIDQFLFFRSRFHDGLQVDPDLIFLVDGRHDEFSKVTSAAGNPVTVSCQRPFLEDKYLGVQRNSMCLGLGNNHANGAVGPGLRRATVPGASPLLCETRNLEPRPIRPRRLLFDHLDAPFHGREVALAVSRDLSQLVRVRVVFTCVLRQQCQPSAVLTRVAVLARVGKLLLHTNQEYVSLGNALPVLVSLQRARSHVEERDRCDEDQSDEDLVPNTHDALDRCLVDSPPEAYSGDGVLLRQ